MKLNRFVWLLFVINAFVGAGLLFMVEPMVGKLLLPRYGGSSAVWGACLAFFQLALLAGYAYAHWSIKRLGVTRQAWVQAGLVFLPLLVLPITLPGWAGSNAAANPTWSVLAVLTICVGAPFLVLATTGPLLQRWLAATNHPRAANPYPLYVASNVGSFVALLSYPFLVEPTLTLSQQRVMWAIGYGLFVILTVACAVARYRLRTTPQAAKSAEPATASLAWPTRLMWVLLAFIPSSLLLGVTTHITSDVAAVPLLWILPLALYLLTFVVAFGHAEPAKLVKRLLPLAAAALFVSTLLAMLPLRLNPAVIVVIYLAAFTVLALVAHGRLSATRPVPARLTEFYLWVSLGGALGGLFNSLLAPLIFNDIYEFPLVLMLALVLLVEWPLRFRRIPPTTPGVVVPSVVLLVIIMVHLVSPNMLIIVVTLTLALASITVLFRRRPAAFIIGVMPLLLVPMLMLGANSNNMVKQRTFYGVIRVQSGGGQHVLRHGITSHGTQYTDAARRHEPLSYYGRQGPLGDIIRDCQAAGPCQALSSLGLGTGTLAAYGRAGDSIGFYEIDPAIVKLATNPRYFTYLSDTPAKVHTVVGDGRLTLQKSAEKYDVLVIDAFSSDAIPTHLLTREAFDLYRQHLKPHGRLAVHISNRVLNLEPVVRVTARTAGLEALIRHDKVLSSRDGRLSSRWIALTSSPADLQALDRLPGWRPLTGGQGHRPWTDDYSNILDAL